MTQHKHTTNWNAYRVPVPNWDAPPVPVPIKKRIALGMSGGVDSAVACALLVQDGWDVVGVSCIFLDDATSRAAAEDAKRVAEQLGVEHVIVDACAAFERNVVGPFVEEYAQGLTPSPCVVCNATTKIPALIDAAHKLGCEAWATGHYARVVKLDANDAIGTRLRYLSHGERFAIQVAAHVQKDQSYMLAALSQDELAHLVLPLGALSKQEVRDLASQLKLSVAQKPESQDICFAPFGYRALLHTRGISQRPGPIVNTSGEVLGTHTGLCDYTIGQRKGIGVAAREPYYVIDKRPAQNELVIGFSAEAKITEVLIGDVVWQALSQLDGPYKSQVKLRYRSAAGTCIIEPAENNTVRVCLDAPQTMTAPGQFAVLYERDVVLGSGKILEVKSS